MSTALPLITIKDSCDGAQPKLVREDLVHRLDYMEQLLHSALKASQYQIGGPCMQS